MLPRECEIWQTMWCNGPYCKGGCDCSLTLWFPSFLFLLLKQPETYLLFFSIYVQALLHPFQFFLFFLYSPFLFFLSLPLSFLPSFFLNLSFLLPSSPPPLLSFEKGEAGAKDSFSGVEMTTWCLCCKYYKNTHQTKLINFNSVTIHQESRMFCFSCSENTLLNFLLFQL